jgi:F-type H+-transporting ATPase subunit c
MVELFSSSALASGLSIGLGALGVGVGIGIASSKALEGIARQPDAEGKISKTLILSIVFMEAVAIYCLVISLILLFANPLPDKMADTAGKLPQQQVEQQH